MLLALDGAARAAPDEDEPQQPAEAEASPPPKAELQPAPPVTTREAPATPEPYIEHMGPETFPGRLRGLYGGSLWLEPSFHGLPWPNNARTGLGVSGMFWVDGGYERIKRDQPLLLDSTMHLQQGRGVLRMTPAYVRDSFFVQGQAELVANLCQAPAPASQTVSVCSVAGTFTTDDLWIRVGQKNLWDAKVGRFEAWEIYHLGMGLDPYTMERLGARMFGQAGSPSTDPQLEAPSVYAVNYMHDRPSEGLGVGYAAVHLYLTDYLRFELLGKWGSDNYQDNSTTAGSKPYNYLGGRPTAIFDVGWFKFKIGGEYQEATTVLQTVGGSPGQPQSKKDSVEELVRWGIGASAQFIVDPIIEFGLNAAFGRQHYTDSSANVFANPLTMAQSYTTKSVGGFANVRLIQGWLAGLGANWTTQLDGYMATGSSADDYTTHLQGFAALQYLLAGQLYIRAVFAYAQARFQPSDIQAPVWSNYMYSGRIRLTYLY